MSFLPHSSLCPASHPGHCPSWHVPPSRRPSNPGHPPHPAHPPAGTSPNPAHPPIGCVPPDGTSPQPLPAFCCLCPASSKAPLRAPSRPSALLPPTLHWCPAASEQPDGLRARPLACHRQVCPAVGPLAKRRLGHSSVLEAAGQQSPCHLIQGAGRPGGATSVPVMAWQASWGEAAPCQAALAKHSS